MDRQRFFLKRTQRTNFKGKTEIGHQYSKDITKYKKGRHTGDKKIKVVIQNLDKGLDLEYIKNSNKNTTQFSFFYDGQMF